MAMALRSGLRTTGRWLNRASLVVGAMVVTIFYAPEVLAFPHHQRFGTTDVWSEAPIPARLPAVLARADALVAASPLAGGDQTRRIFLTQGGWRWRLAAFRYGGAFGLRRPLSSALLFNRSDVARDRIYNGRTIGGERTLSGVIAHETAHLLITRRFGEVRAIRAPAWLNEGLADTVARESSLSDADAAKLRRDDPKAPGLFYYDARRRVEAELAANGGSAAALYDRFD